MSGSARVVLLTNTYTPYRAPVWRALADKVGKLDVILLREREANRNWDVISDDAYSIRTLDTKGFYIPNIDSGLYWGGDIGKLLTSLDPTHLIVSGFSAPPFINAILWARIHNIPLVQWYYSHELSSRFKRGPIRWLRKWILQRADAWATTGVMARDYLIDMDIPPERIELISNPVDVSIYRTAINSLGMPKGPARILYVGQFIERKGVYLLLEAFQQMSCEASLRLVGYGPMEAELKQKSLSIPNVEFYPATSNPRETVKHYGWADIVVMPSYREVWGLVVNEALAAGCYVLSSCDAGVTPDLVDNSPVEVGKSIDPARGPFQLSHAMEEVVGSIEKIRERREEISAWGMQHTPRRTADGLWRALLKASS